MKKTILWIVLNFLVWVLVSLGLIVGLFDTASYCMITIPIYLIVGYILSQNELGPKTPH